MKPPKDYENMTAGEIKELVKPLEDRIIILEEAVSNLTHSLNRTFDIVEKLAKSLEIKP